jgi:hypothetical protein
VAFGRLMVIFDRASPHYLPSNVRFYLKAIGLLRAREMTRWATASVAEVSRTQ